MNYEDYVNTQAPDTKLGELDHFSLFSRKEANYVKRIKKGDPGYEKANRDYRALVAKYLNMLSRMPSAKE